MANPQGPFEARRGEVERSYSVRGGVSRLLGFRDLARAGEVTDEVMFPVWFLERPGISGGGECAPNEPLVDGEFPRWSVGVHHWITEERGGVGETGLVTFYRGAVFIFVAEGPETMRSTIHWQLEGRALRNPLLGGDSTAEEVQ